MSKISIKALAIATVIGGAILGATIASAALNLPTQNCSYSFERNFTLGSTGTDVMNLQKVLNAYPQTQVSESGAGSPGNESTYYGAKTKTAVIKFQNLHAADILTPNGLTAGNGNVYASTRSMLNRICTGVAGTTTSTVPGCLSLVGFSSTTGQSCATGATTSTVQGCTSVIGFSPTTGQSCATNTTTNPVSTGPVSVSLAGNQPQQMIVLGQSGARLADFTFTGNGTVTNVQLQRTGISVDAALTNVYLYDGNVRITDAASVVTGGYINFNSPQGLFTVNGSRTVSVRADIASTAGYAGNSIGVKLNSVTTLGGSAATFTNVQGNQLVLAGITGLSAIAFADVIGTALTVDAGTTNYNVWSGSATVSQRAANLKAATFKFVGSAPVDSLANISLYVDGVKIGNSTNINAANNNKVTFDLGATPFVLTTGTHTFDVRADIVKGSFRTITMSIENVSDLMIEDSTLAGVNVSATFNTVAFTQANATYGTITVNKGSVTTNVDPSFVANKVTGGATAVPVGQFTMRAYGEDVKVSTLNLTFATTSPITTLNNVALYVNGGQVGTSQNFLGTAALSYTLGSSLIIPANTTVTITVKADIVDAANAAYTSGTIAAKITGGAVGQGQSSYEAVDVAATVVTGNTLSVSSGAGTFARTSGFTAVTVSPNTANVKIGSFTIQANSAENIKVTSIGVSPVPTGSNGSAANAITNYSNLTVKTGSTVLGTPVGNPASGTTTFSFSELTIPANGTQTFDVYADVGSAASSTDNPKVTTAMSVTYRGAISNTTTVSSAAGIIISSAAATLAVPTLVSSSPVAQYVVGGSTFGIATFKLATAVTGTQANVRELRFITAGTDAITSITVGGVTSPVIGSGSAATTTVSGLSINIDSNGTDVPVTVKFSGYQGSTSGGSLITSNVTTSVTLGYIEGTSGSGSVITQITGVPSANMSLVASKPTVTVSAGNTDSLVLNAENKIGEFTVTADANGKIAIASTSLTVSAVGVTAGYEFTGARIADGNTTISTAVTTGSTTIVSTFATAYEISAGTSKTFSVYATLTGTAQASITPYVTSRLTSAASFKWNDVLGGTSGLTLAGTNIYNFPTSSFSTKR